MNYQPHEYACIAAWGRRMGSFNYYITAQQKLAAQDEAPITAIYKDVSTGEWHRAEDIKDPVHRRNILGDMFVEDDHGQYGTEWDVEHDRFDRLPRVCAARMETETNPILIHRGTKGYTPLPKGFDVARFNNQRGIQACELEAMVNGSMFGWHLEVADPMNCTGEGFAEDAGETS